MVASKTRLGIAAGAILAIAAAGGVGIAAANGAGDDNEAPITGDALQKASSAALAHTGGGSVSETEVGDEDALYEVEVTLDDGSQVDVHLDASFTVVSDEADAAGEDESGADD